MKYKKLIITLMNIECYAIVEFMIGMHENKRSKG